MSISTEGGSSAKVKFMDRQAAIVLIIRDTNVVKFPVGYEREILTVTNRRFGTLVLPGGKTEPGETPIQTAIRELQEEVSVVVEPPHLHFIGSSVNVVEGLADREVFLYLATQTWGKPTNVEEGTEIYWRSFNQFAEESFFSAYYKRHLPEGIDHLPSTRMMG